MTGKEAGPRQLTGQGHEEPTDSWLGLSRETVPSIAPIRVSAGLAMRQKNTPPHLLPCAHLSLARCNLPGSGRFLALQEPDIVPQSSQVRGPGGLLNPSTQSIKMESKQALQIRSKTKGPFTAGIGSLHSLTVDLFSSFWFQTPGFRADWVPHQLALLLSSSSCSGHNSSGLWEPLSFVSLCGSWEKELG